MDHWWEAALSVYIHAGEQSTCNRCPSPIVLDELSAVCQKNFIRRIDQVTNGVLNSPAPSRTGNRVSRPYAFIALPHPSLPARLGSSTRILIDCRIEGLLTVGNYSRRWNGQDIRSRCRRMSFG
jgi:hypothetical protein